MDDFLYKHVMMNYPHLREEDIEEAIEISDYDLLIKFKNGTKIIFDTFRNKQRYIDYESEDLTDEQWGFEFRTRLRNIMKRNFVNQEELAKRIGTTQNMISRYMTGQSIPSARVIDKMARALGCSTEDFFYRHY